LNYGLFDVGPQILIACIESFLSLFIF